VFLFQPDLTEVASVILERLKVLADSVGTEKTILAPTHEESVNEEHHTEPNKDTDNVV